MQNTPQTPRRPAAGQPAQRPVQRSAQGAARPAGAGQPVAQRSPQRPVQRPPQRPPQGSSGGEGIVNHAPSPALPLAIVACVLAVGILLQFVLMPQGWVFAEKARATEAVAEISSSRGVRINEVMTANKSACYDENGATPDWIELYNASNSPVNITGWVLTDKTSRSIRFTFPEYVMQPGDYVLVFADGELQNDPTDTFHAPFKLSSLGDTLLLFDESGTIVESINIPAMEEDYSYARMASGWTVTREYTPLLENTTLNYAQLTTTQILQNSDLIITEVMASNASYRSPSGMLCDWVEIYNRGTDAIDLFGYALSDKTTKPARWRFPHVTIQPGEYMVVYCSGLDRVLDSGEMHTNFSLSAEGESAILYSPSRQVMDMVTYDNLKTDQSWKRQSDGSFALSTNPTPGSGN